LRDIVGPQLIINDPLLTITILQACGFLPDSHRQKP